VFVALLLVMWLLVALLPAGALLVAQLLVVSLRVASLRRAGSGWGFTGAVWRLRARHRFVNLVAALLRFPSLAPEAPHPLPARRNDSL